ncbi:hypothetical protein ACWDSL_36755 [Streptomyces sp. NPDC000941]
MAGVFMGVVDRRRLFAGAALLGLVHRGRVVHAGGLQALDPRHVQAAVPGARADQQGAAAQVGADDGVAGDQHAHPVDRRGQDLP